MKAALVVLAACGAPPSRPIVKPPEPPPAPVASAKPTPDALAAFDRAWDRVRLCLIGDGELADLDPRDALPIMDARTHGESETDRCPALDGLVAAVPAHAPDLAAAVAPLPKAWAGTHYFDDTGNHTIYGAVEVFANALRDADDWRVALHKEVGIPVTPLGSRRIPAVTVVGAFAAKGHHVGHLEHLRDHVLVVVGHRVELAYWGPTTAMPVVPRWRADVDEKTKVLSVDEPRAVVATKVEGRVVHRIGSGTDRVIVFEPRGRSGDERALYASRDGGVTWKLALPPTKFRRLEGDPRALDMLLDDARWLHISGDGVIAPAVAIAGKQANQTWTCASSEMLWLVNETTATWTDRTGAHGTMPYRGYGGFTCTGRALLANNARHDYMRCVAGAAACGEETSAWGRADLASDGIIVATDTGSIITITRTGARAATTRARLPSGDQMIGFVVWNDTPTFVVRSPDESLYLATP